ncbi:flagellar hook capping FlgD N-terminal domain-containing protein [Clostridium sp.]|uniref:flagellar hook assembly protein FlgD n=1 Tax=Clostridium sp. TaxID=1506 RepID=UPI00261A6905|nr:flagellar hook capping FlgD N-terminal domain-containing protein [Clostridium sp.]
MAVINNYTGVRATDRGTKIVGAGGDMDKNAFLTILSAELSNLDPSGNNDSTQYITQMAQFASMEQMTNLNNTMTGYANNGLLGKGVGLNVVDSKGVAYTGVVKGVSNTVSGTIISVLINENGENVYKDFNIKDVTTVIDVDDYSLPTLNNINGNISFLTATNFIGKNVELSEKDEKENKLTGEVLGVSKENGLVYLRIKLDGTGEIKEYTLDKIVKVNNKEEDKEENPNLPEA